MAAKRSMRRRSPKKRGGFHGRSFLAGVALGAGGVGLATVFSGLLSEQFARLPDVMPGEDDFEVVFEFQELLRQPVPVDPDSYGDPGARANSPAPAARTETASPAASHGAPEPAATAPVRITEIYVQAASFRDAGEADQLRARLLLQNLPVSLGEVVLGDGTWHRVTVGPIGSEEMADEVMARLREQNLSAMRIDPG